MHKHAMREVPGYFRLPNRGITWRRGVNRKPASGLLPPPKQTLQCFTAPGEQMFVKWVALAVTGPWGIAQQLSLLAPSSPPLLPGLGRSEPFGSWALHLWGARPRGSGPLGLGRGPHLACRERKQTEKAKAGRTRPCFLPGAERLHGGRGRAPEAGLSQPPSIRAAALTVRAAASTPPGHLLRNAPFLDPSVGTGGGGA